MAKPKALSRYLSGTPDTSEPPAIRPRWQCLCHGCPATAGIDAGGGEVICRFHHGAPASTWQAITDRLRKNEWMVRAADYCAAGDPAPGWAERAKAAAEAAGRPELAPCVRMVLGGVMRDERLHPILYAQRLNAILASECVIGRKAPSLPMVRSRSEDAVRVADVLPKLG